MSAAELFRVVDQMVDQISRWTPGHWAAPAEPGGPSRADVVYALVQRLADLAAEAEGQPWREVPRLENDLSLADQLRVVTADLVAAGASELLTHAAAADVSSIRADL